MKHKMLAALLLAITVPLWAEELTLDDFEGASNWVFSNGPEFPGAAGSITSAPGHTGNGMRLSFDMSGGGVYVSATRDLARPATAKAVAFWALSPGGARISVRAVDETGQTLQCAVSTRLETPGSPHWRRMFADLSAPMFHWDGANDGVLHGNIRQVGILIEPYKNNDRHAVVSGSLDIDDVSLVDSFGDDIDLRKAPAHVSGAGDLAGKLGVNIHFTDDDKALDIIRDAGFKWVRMDLVWMDVEKKPGIYDFAAYDRLVSSLKARGLNALFILDYGNPLYIGGWNKPPLTEKAKAAFASFAGACAKHFAGKGVRYEVWNEPNLDCFWSGPDAGEYAGLAREVSYAVKDNDPKAQVAVGALSAVDLSFLDKIMESGWARAADAVSVHPYRHHAPETACDDIAAARALIAKRVPKNILQTTPPVWDSEWGYSSAWYGPGDSEAARRTQAKFAARELLSCWIMGFPMIIYYDIRDDGVNPADPEHNFGLLANDYKDKPAMTAVRFLLAELKGRTLKGMYPHSENGINTVVLDGAADRVVIAWSPVSSGEVRFSQRPGYLRDMLGKDLPAPETSTIKLTDEPLYCYFPKLP